MNTPSIDRRSILSGAALAGTGAATGLFRGSAAAAEKPNTTLPKSGVVLFQGDSITDAGRDRRREGNANNSAMLGRGYPFHIAAYLLQRYPELDLKVYNRGISGHKVPDLAGRWDKDCIDLKPAVLSILVGVNDIWHKMNGNYDGTVDTYETGFAALLERTTKALPDTKIVVCEPFALRCGAVKDTWFPEFDQRRARAKKVAEAAGTTFITFQTMFDDAVAAGTAANYWAGDGVHPSVAGHGLMAKTWIESLGL